jgi:hypothetical protein
MSLESKNALIEYLTTNYKPGQQWKEIGAKFNLEPEKARRIWLKHRKDNGISNIPPTTQTLSTIVTELQEDFKTGKAEVTIQSPQEIKDLNDLSKLIDTEKWEISKYVQNYWNGKYQVKAWLEPKKVKEIEVFERLLKNYKTDWKSFKTPSSRPYTKSQSLLVLNLNDLHFDKLDLNNNTIDQRIDDYFIVFNDLVIKSISSFFIEQAVFVVGNDVFNTDNIQNTTTNGTPQSVNTTWDVAYEKVFDTMVKSIATLSKSIPNVHVILVQGNHDRTKSYYLAHALELYFKGDPAITFDRTSNPKKCLVWGQSFIGFNHGNNVNDKLPLAFATEFSANWGLAKYHDILISDKHHNNEKTFRSNQTQNEFQGVKLRILPSLSGTDRWHNDNLYRSRQSGVALIYDKERGKSAEFEYQL